MAKKLLKETAAQRLEKKNANHQELLKDAVQNAAEELLQYKGVSIQKTLEAMEDLETLIQGHIEGLEDDIRAGRT